MDGGNAFPSLLTHPQIKNNHKQPYDHSIFRISMAMICLNSLIKRKYANYFIPVVIQP